MPTNDPLINEAERLLRVGVFRKLIKGLKLAEQTHDAVRAWIANLDLRDVIVFDPENRPCVTSVVFPLLSLELSLAQLRRDHRLADDQSQREYDAIRPHLVAAWNGLDDVPRVDGDVLFPCWDIETPDGDVRIDPVGDALDALDVARTKP
jgi:hypothetical protein